ncbi:MAG: alpha/beta fold hydrolase [Lewinellaceae bacterium]|nr:alpha/beta fold hydrolase [Lewinellaceae bacterium]
MVKLSNFHQLLGIIGAGVRHHYIEAAGIRTSFLEAGAGPALVLLHGAGGGAVTWYKVIAPLARHHRVIAFDRPGYGESEKPSAPYDKPFNTNWLRHATERLGLQRFSLVGNSEGGSAGIHYSLNHPEQLEKLVLVGSAGLGDNWNKAIILKMALYKLFPSPIWGELLGRNVMQNPDDAHPAWHDYSIDVLKSKGGRRAFFQGRGRAVITYTDEELQAVATPTLLIWGEDEAFFPVSHGERAAQLIPGARLEVIPGAGHLPFMEKPEVFCGLVEGFLGS